MQAWLGAGLGSLLVFAAGLLLWDRWNRKQDSVRLVKAVLAGDLAELSMVLRERVDLRAVPAWFGEPALIIAVKSAQAGCRTGCGLEACRLMLAYGADIDERGTEWKTALMHAAAGGSLDLCKLLISCGADPQACDAFGRTAAWWAERGGHSRVASLLRGAET